LKSDYVAAGELVTHDGITAYVTGDRSSTKGVILVHDVWGIQSGRIKNVADQIAEAGFVVAAPDIYDGKTIDDYGGISSFSTEGTQAWIRAQDMDKCSRFIDKACDYLAGRGVTSFGIAGFCWGVVPSFHVSAKGRFRALVGFHPSLQAGPWLYGLENENTLTRDVACPTLLLPAGNDPEYVKPGGETLRILQEKPFGAECSSVEFPDMAHGWVVRGDLSDDKVQRDVKAALELATAFFQKHV